MVIKREQCAKFGAGRGDSWVLTGALTGVLSAGLLAGVLVGLLVLGTGCSLITGSRAPKAAVATVPEIFNPEQGKTKEAPLTLPELQALTMGFADGFFIGMAAACDRLKDQFTNSVMRSQIQQWKLSHGTILTLLASGQNASIALVDLVGTTTLSRMILEDYWIPEVFGAKGDDLLAVHRQNEQEIWEIAAKVLTDKQQENLHELIRAWHQENEGQRYVSFISITDYVKARAQAPKTANDRSPSILSLLRLDPLSGLDPTTHAIQETRQFAQRAMYYIQRMPTLIRWQTEMLAMNLVNSEAGQQVLNDLHGYRVTADRLTDVIEGLPDKIAVAQKDVLRDLERESTQLRQLAVELKSTFEAGTAMAEAVRGATEAIEDLAGRKGEAAVGEAGKAGSSRPFDVREYGAAAAEITRASVELRGAIEALNQLVRSEAWQERSADIATVIGQAETGGERVLDKAVYWGCVLIGVFLAGLVLSLLFYRWAARKWIGD